MSVITVKRTVIQRMPKKTSTTRRSFRELTRSYLANENRLEFAIETLLFAIMIVVSAWPSITAAGALNEFLQRASG